MPLDSFSNSLAHYMRINQCPRPAELMLYLPDMTFMPRFCSTLLLLIGFTAPVGGEEVLRTASPSERGLTEDDFPRMQELAPNVYTYEALTGPADDRYTTNTLFVVTNAGVLVADGQGSPEETEELVTAISRVTDQRVTHVVICSDHGDHTNGNQSFPEDATFIAHRNSLPALERAAESGGVLPDTIVDDRLDLELGDRNMQILFLGRAHTGGDLFVWLPDEKILFTTEVFLNHMFSGFRTAYTREWIATMNEAEKLGADLYIPGHGFIDDRQVLNEEWHQYKDHLQVVLSEVERLHGAGLTVDEAIEQADFGAYANWSGSESQGPIGIRRIYAELNGELKVISRVRMPDGIMKKQQLTGVPMKLKFRKNVLPLLVAAIGLSPTVTLYAAPQSPEEVFGFRPGDDYKLASYEQMETYYRQLAAASDRVQLREIGQSVLGRPLFLLTISSRENLANLDRYRDISEQLARARPDPETADALTPRR